MRTPARLTSLRARCHAVLFMVLTPSDVIQNSDVWPVGLECFPRDYKDTAADFGYRNLPTPLQAADIAFAQAGVDGEKNHAGESRRQFGKEPVLLIPSDGVGWTGGLR